MKLQGGLKNIRKRRGKTTIQASTNGPDVESMTKLKKIKLFFFHK